jgi:hypothetical protein
MVYGVPFLMMMMIMMMMMTMISIAFSFTILYKFLGSNGKGKTIPAQAWISPEGSRSLRLPDFMTVGT